MTSILRNSYEPNYVSLPGETIQEILEEREMTQAELALRMGRPKKTISEIINGKTAITPETALQLEHALGVPARFWNNLEQHYREYKASIDERNKLKDHLEWLTYFPVEKMVEYGWIKAASDRTEQLIELLNFFGIAHPSLFEETCAAFRKSQDSNSYAVAAWLQRGIVEATKQSCASYNEQKFKLVLSQIRLLTVQPCEIFEPELKGLCASAGVTVIPVRELPNAKVCGATHWLNPHRPIILISLRYKKTDHFWFTFFHEAAHVLKHAKRGNFLDYLAFEDGKEEDEANRFAADFLIPPDAFERFKSSGKVTKQSVISFAAEIGIDPGIVVGRLQHDKTLKFNQMNDLKSTLKWK